MKWDETLQRIATDASRLRPSKAAVTIVAFPFYLLGLVLGLLWLACVVVWAAVAVGLDAGRHVGPMRARAEDE